MQAHQCKSQPPRSFTDPFTLPANLIAADVQQQIIDGLSGPGWCVIPGFIPGGLIQQLQYEAHHAWRQDSFHQAGVGQGVNFSLRDQIRNDQVLWLDAEHSPGALKQYLNLMDEFKQLINRNLYLGLDEYEGHLAAYPPGAFYRKHLDQFRGDDRRTVTAILYLNDDWYTADGGQLRIYTDADEQSYQDILPRAGQLVTFLSARFVHEVLPANRNRLSITGWFKRRAGI